MADFEELNFSYLGLLSNAHHDGTTQQIDDACANFETENQTFHRKATALHQCRVKEDEAWKKSQVDPVVKQLQAADKRQDNYMSCFHSIGWKTHSARYYLIFNSLREVFPPFFHPVGWKSTL